MQFDMNRLWEGLAGLLSVWGVKVLGALAVLIIGRMAAGWARGLVRKALIRAKFDETLIPFFASMVYYLLLVFVAVAVLGLFGVPTASVIAVLGAAGLALGLALQGTLSNFASGVMLLIFRPFGVGDFVEVAGISGTVKGLRIFDTVLDTPDNKRITIPNGSVYGSTITNYSANDTRRVDLVIGVSYDDDLSKAQQVIERIVHADDRVLKDPAPTIAVSELGACSVDFVVRPWCAKGDYWPLRFDLTRRLKDELEAAGCSIPYPQQDVHLHQLQPS